MLLVQPIIDSVNSFGYSISSTVTTFLGINHVLASKLVSVLVTVFTWFKEVFITIISAVRILLEDLHVFLREALESVIFGVELCFSVVDGLINGVHSLCQVVKNCVWLLIGGVETGFSQTRSAFVYIFEYLGDFFQLLGSSIMLLLQLFPKTLYLLANGIWGMLDNILISSKEAVTSSFLAFVEAPLEMMVGFLAGLFILYSSFRILRKLFLQYQITPGVVLNFSLRAILLVYFNVLKYVLVFIKIIFKCITVTLRHLHVPRFHHAGDSDNEDEDEDGNGVVFGYDSSDNEEMERQDVKRRNYDLLCRRRQQKKTRNKRQFHGEEDMEEMLFEQVEREREDKLCVICQDKEKCIMILPCRHLCLCQDCTAPLQAQGNNICPICRKNVRQTIKAYL